MTTTIKSAQIHPRSDRVVIRPTEQKEMTRAESSCLTRSKSGPRDEK